jgi:protein-tyrosine kinase
VTRLTEAFERARATSGSSANVPRELPSRPGRPPADEVPQSWRFDPEDRVAETTSPPEPPPEAWDIELPGADRVDAEPQTPSEAAPEHNRFEAVPRRTGVIGEQSDPALAEQYRRLAASLHHAQLQSGARRVLIVSAIEAEGKTLTAVNLALTLSRSYQKRVLLVDADLRRPMIHARIGLDNRMGLRDTLKQAIPGGPLPLQCVSPTLWVMTAGQPTPDPMSGLVSDTMRQFLTEAAEQFDWIVIDSPPVALLPDANLLAEMVDVALLVVRAKSTPYAMVTRAIEEIGAGKILGVVLNRIDRSDVMLGYGDYGYSYGPPDEGRRSFRLLSRKG